MNRFPNSTSLPLLTVLVAVVFTLSARANDSAEILSISPPALAFAHYIAALNQRNPFTESGPVAIEIDASLPRLGKEACLTAIRATGASERSEYEVLHIGGDSMVEQEVIARYLSAQAQAEAHPLSSLLIAPANYKFRYRGSVRSLGALLYVFQVNPRKRRVGLIQGRLWIDPATGIAVHEAGHFVKTPSVFLHRIDIVRDTTLRNGFPCVRVTHTVIDTRLPVGRAELTITERPLTASDEAAALRLAGEER